MGALFLLEKVPLTEWDWKTTLVVFIVAIMLYGVRLPDHNLSYYLAFVSSNWLKALCPERVCRL